MKKEKSNKKALAIKIIAIILAIILILLIVASNFMYSFFLRNDSIIPREKMTDLLIKNTGINTQFFGITPESRDWFLANNKEVTITSNDGLELHGFYIENENNTNHNYVIMCHGYSCKARFMSNHMREIYKFGFDILAPDSRAHGSSEGDTITMGYYEKDDLMLWINSIIEKDKDANILIMGVSMGASTVLLTSGEDSLPSNVKAVISDCAYTTAYDEFKSQSLDVAHIPPHPIIDMTSLVAKIRAGFSFKDVDCIQAVKRSTTPTLFIHGTDDTFVPARMLDELYENANCEKQKLLVDGAVHANSANVEPELYWSTVDNFLKNYFSYELIK